MSYTSYYESVNFTSVLNKQLDRIAEAASNLDLTSKANARRTLLSYLMSIRALYALVKDLKIMHGLKRWDAVLDKLIVYVVSEKYPFNVDNTIIRNPYDVIKKIDEILGDIVNKLFEAGLLISLDVLRVE